MKASLSSRVKKRRSPKVTVPPSAQKSVQKPKAPKADKQLTHKPLAPTPEPAIASEVPIKKSICKERRNRPSATTHHHSHTQSQYKPGILATASLQTNIVIQKLIDTCSGLIPFKTKRKEPFQEPQKERLSSDQKDIWQNCLTAIKDNEFEKIEGHLKHGSRNDRRIIREKLLSDFESYPFLIGNIQQHLAKEE